MMKNTSVTEDVEEVLLDLKEQALAATRRKDGEFYRDYLADDAIAIVPFGIFGKDAIIQQMTGDSPFKSTRIEDTRAIVLTDEIGIVTYKATFEAKAGSPFEVIVSTTYAKREGKWKGVFYQQTPLKKPGEVRQNPR